MMKKIIGLFLFSVTLLSLFSFDFTYAQDAGFLDGSSLVPCGTDRGPVITDPVTNKETAESRKILNPCGFEHVLAFINKMVHFLIFDLALPISAIMFAYAGFLLITSGGEVNKKNKAKEIFWNVVIGLIIAAAAFVIINTILSIVGYTGDWTHF